MGHIEILLTFPNPFLLPMLNSLFVGQAIVGVLGAVICPRPDFKRGRVDIEKAVALAIAAGHVPHPRFIPRNLAAVSQSTGNCSRR